MPIALSRVDDRLIHGQVVIGWGVPLGVDLIVLVDDEIGANAWEQEIYRMAVPEEIAVEFLTAAGAVPRLRALEADARRVFLLTGDIATMAKLVTGSEGVLRRVNLGGVHAGPGRRERLRYLFLSDDEVSQLRRMEAAGTVVTAQDLPTTPPVALQAIL
jgi:PTS system mannose-specific IIB component/fructoselysine and glucoselysine-specific PTS system IIB component